MSRKEEELMKTVITPRLHFCCGDLCSTSGFYSSFYFCRYGFDDFIDFPEDAKYYWVEASDRQFPERNGCAVEVWFDKYDEGRFLYSRPGTVSAASLCYTLSKLLKKLGVGEEPKRIYFRLWYQ